MTTLKALVVVMAFQIYLDKFTMMEYSDSPQFSVAAFLSQLGGALNLWAGITVVVVIEVIELIYETASDKWRTKKSARRRLP